MSKQSNIARRAVALPAAQPKYEQRDEQAFRHMLEQELQRVYALVAELAAEIEAMP